MHEAQPTTTFAQEVELVALILSNTGDHRDIHQRRLSAVQIMRALGDAR